MTDKPIQHNRCSNTSLRALGFDPQFTCYKGVDALGVINEARSKGLIDYRIIGQSADWNDPESMWFGGVDRKATVKRFVETHPEGSFFIIVSGHALALINGVLTDTEERGPDGRIVKTAFQIFRKPKPVAMKDPSYSWGETPRPMIPGASK